MTLHSHAHTHFYIQCFDWDDSCEDGEQNCFPHVLVSLPRCFHAHCQQPQQLRVWIAFFQNSIGD